MKNLIQSATEVFTKLPYVLITLFSGILIGFLMVWLSNYELIGFALSSNLFDWIGRAEFSLMGISLILFTIYRLGQKIQSPKACATIKTGNRSEQIH